MSLKEMLDTMQYVVWKEGTIGKAEAEAIRNEYADLYKENVSKPFMDLFPVLTSTVVRGCPPLEATYQLSLEMSAMALALRDRLKFIETTLIETFDDFSEYYEPFLKTGLVAQEGGQLELILNREGEFHKVVKIDIREVSLKHHESVSLALVENHEILEAASSLAKAFPEIDFELEADYA